MLHSVDVAVEWAMATTTTVTSSTWPSSRRDAERSGDRTTRAAEVSAAAGMSIAYVVRVPKRAIASLVVGHVHHASPSTSSAVIGCV